MKLWKWWIFSLRFTLLFNLIFLKLYSYLVLHSFNNCSKKMNQSNKSYWHLKYLWVLSRYPGTLVLWGYSAGTYNRHIGCQCTLPDTHSLLLHYHQRYMCYCSDIGHIDLKQYKTPLVSCSRSKGEFLIQKCPLQWF